LFPELQSLAQLLTQKYPPSSNCLTWSVSSNVNVIVVDITKEQEPEQTTIEHIKDLKRLQEVATQNVSNGTLLRLFLVEDVTAPVIEVLGCAFTCYLSFFEEHMHTMGYKRENKIDENGNATSYASVSSFHKGKLRSSTEARSLPFFSLPFRRSFKYKSNLHQEIHNQRRTMFREYHEDECLLEERATGVFHSIGDAKVGKLYPLIDFENE
jgi:hypothetical protein